MERIIYKIQFPNNKVYIGQTNDLKRRMRTYKYLCCKSQPQLLNAIQKYKLDNCLITILAIGNDDNIDILERKYITKYKATEKTYGYNIEIGGCKTKVFSKETRQKLSEAKKGRKLSNETKEKIANALRGVPHTEERKLHLKEAHADFSGKNNPFYGKKHTEETKQKISKTKKLYNCA